MSATGSGVIVKLAVAVPVLPAASEAVAVHVLTVVVLTLGAVKVDPENTPPLSHVTVGPEATPILSVAVTFMVTELPDSKVDSDTLNVTFGAVVSATGAGSGGGVELALVELPLPPPQPEIAKAEIKAVTYKCRFMVMMFPYQLLHDTLTL